MTFSDVVKQQDKMDSLLVKLDHAVNEGTTTIKFLFQKEYFFVTPCMINLESIFGFTELIYGI